MNDLLKNRVLGIAKDDGVWECGIKNLKIARRHYPTELTKCFYNSMILYMVQGAKKTVWDNMEFTYREGQCIVTSIDMPSASAITEASPEKPMLCVALDFDKILMAEMLQEIIFPKIDKSVKQGIGVINANEALTDAFLRLLSLNKEPEKQRNTLASFIIKEIYYRLLMSPVGNELRLAYTAGTQSNQISKAIIWLKENFAKPLNVEELAYRVNMSPTSFYRHFNKITKITPVQYQKQLRLYEAQKLLMSDKMSAENAGYKVGYKSTNQFNRDYKRMFGKTPAADVKAKKGVMK